MSEYNRGGPVSLYLHFPFCERKCRYCDFLSGPAGEETREEYVDLLCREIELRAGEITAPSESAAAVNPLFDDACSGCASDGYDTQPVSSPFGRGDQYGSKPRYCGP